MKMIPRNIHGAIDYLAGLLIMAAPWLFGFAGNRPATTVAVAVGAGALLYSLLTKYEMGLIKVIPFKAHLVIDFFSGAFLAASPWLFGFADSVYLPHLIFGLFEMAAALTTKDQAMAVHHKHAHSH